MVELNLGRSCVNLHRANGGAAPASPGLGESLLVQVGALGAAGQVGLHLPVLGKVQGGNLLGFLNLLLVGLDLLLQLLHKISYPILVLLVFLLLNSKHELQLGKQMGEEVSTKV